MDRAGDPEETESVSRRAIEVGDVDAPADLSRLIEPRDVDEAERMNEWPVAAEPDPTAKPRVDDEAIHVDVEGLRAAFQEAIDAGDPDEAPRAATSLGVLLKEQGDVDGARAAFQLAIDSGHPELSRWARQTLREPY